MIDKKKSMESAFEGYKKVMKIREEKAIAEIEKIEIVMNTAKSKGELQCVVESMSQDASDKLKTLGYTIKVEVDRNETYVTIGWDVGKTLNKDQISELNKNRIIL
jgi:hypothetical protein